MMRISRRFALASGLAPALSLLAGEPWKEKKPSEWTDKDLVRVLNDSPWAQVVEITMGTPALSMVGGGPGGFEGMPPGTRKPPSLPFLIRWVSAIPIKVAYSRARLGKDVDALKQAEDYLERPEKHYVVAVICPPRYSPPWKGDDVKEKLKTETVLQRKGRPDLRPESVEIASGVRQAIVFRFPRTGEINMSDQNVEFATTFALTWAKIYIRRSFPLKDMAWQGKLTL